MDYVIMVVNHGEARLILGKLKDAYILDNGAVVHLRGAITKAVPLRPAETEGVTKTFVFVEVRDGRALYQAGIEVLDVRQIREMLEAYNPEPPSTTWW